MKLEDYKNKFIELFKQMEEDLGKCAEVYIESDDEQCPYDETVIHTLYKCTIKF